MKLNKEESNYSVINKVLKALKSGHSNEKIISSLEEFLNHKKEIAKNLSGLSQLARAGDNQAAIELMSELTKMNDGQ